MTDKQQESTPEPKTATEKQGLPYEKITGLILSLIRDAGQETTKHRRELIAILLSEEDDEVKGNKIRDNILSYQLRFNENLVSMSKDDKVMLQAVTETGMDNLVHVTRLLEQPLSIWNEHGAVLKHIGEVISATTDPRTVVKKIKNILITS